jgi:hypothetical protein
VTEGNMLNGTDPRPQRGIFFRRPGQVVVTGKTAKGRYSSRLRAAIVFQPKPRPHSLIIGAAKRQALHKQATSGLIPSESQRNLREPVAHGSPVRGSSCNLPTQLNRC